MYDRDHGQQQFELRPLKLSFSLLKNACLDAFKKYSLPVKHELHWKVTASRNFLSSRYINTEMSKHVLDTASDKRLYHKSIQLMNLLPEPERTAFESTDPILKDYKENKGRYNFNNLPPIYSLH